MKDQPGAVSLDYRGQSSSPLNIFPSHALSINSYPSSLLFLSRFRRMGEDEFQREKFSEIEVVTFLSNLEVKDEAYEVCILAIFSATSEQALLKSGQSLSPIVSDLGRGKAGL